MTQATTPSDDRDALTRFLLQEAGVRGVRVHLQDTWRQIRARADYPSAVEELLGEACAAAALFTGHAKVDGRLSVQLRGDGPLRTLFAECTAAGTLRGIAQIDEAATFSRDLRHLGDNALLVITIENPGVGDREPVRYQGMVALEADALAEAFEVYFRRSEQLPTRLLLALMTLDTASARSSPATRMVMGCFILPITAICVRKTSSSMSGAARMTLSLESTSSRPWSLSCRSVSTTSQPPIEWPKTATSPSPRPVAASISSAAR